MDGERIKEIIGEGDLLHIAERVEEMLDFDTMRQIYDSCACSGGKAYLNSCQRMGKELAGRTLLEKIDHLNRLSDGVETIAINEDGTLTVALAFRSGDRYACALIVEIG